MKVRNGETKECSLCISMEISVRDLQCFVCEKGVVGWKIIFHPQGCRGTFGLSTLESEAWAAPAHIWQHYSIFLPIWLLRGRR